MPNWILSAVLKILLTSVCVCVRACTQQNNAAELINSTVSKEYNPLTQTTLQTIPTCRAKWRRWPLCRTVLHRSPLSQDPPGDGQQQSRTLEHQSSRVKNANNKTGTVPPQKHEHHSNPMTLREERMKYSLPCCKPKQLRALFLVHRREGPAREGQSTVSSTLRALLTVFP